MTDWDEEGAWGSLEELWRALCMSFDMYKEDNIAGALEVKGKLKTAGVKSQKNKSMRLLLRWKMTERKPRDLGR